MLELLGRILQALLDLDTLVGQYRRSEDVDAATGRNEGLMAASFLVVNVLANHSPVLHVKDVLAEEPICVGKAVEDESAPF